MLEIYRRLSYIILKFKVKDLKRQAMQIYFNFYFLSHYLKKNIKKTLKLVNNNYSDE